MTIKNIVGLIITSFLSACASDKHYNIPDIEDKNRVPAEQEARLNDPWNYPDEIDHNDVPDSQEKRLKKEERDYLNDPPVFQ